MGKYGCEGATPSPRVPPRDAVIPQLTAPRLGRTWKPLIHRAPPFFNGRGGEEGIAPRSGARRGVENGLAFHCDTCAFRAVGKRQSISRPIFAESKLSSAKMVRGGRETGLRC